VQAGLGLLTTRLLSLALLYLIDVSPIRLSPVRQESVWGLTVPALTSFRDLYLGSQFQVVSVS